ncbi:MAG: STAS domain-containing protein [Gemmatimonadales bacterium]
MSATQVAARRIVAPEELGIDTRVSFRENAVRELDVMPSGGALTIDCSRTRRVDSAGLSALMLIHRHAADRGQRVALERLSDEFRYLLALTRMDLLFDLTAHGER